VKQITLVLACLVIGAFAVASPGAFQGKSTGEQFVGTWSGTWDGAGTGGFELTLEKPKEGPVTGKVTVTGEPTYKADFRTLAFDGDTMKAAYDFPPDPAAEVLLTATFEGKTAKGTWVARVKATGMEIATGTWTVSKP